LMYVFVTILNFFLKASKESKLFLSSSGHCDSGLEMVSSYSFCELRFPSCGRKGSTSHLKQFAGYCFQVSVKGVFLCPLHQKKKKRNNQSQFIVKQSIRHKTLTYSKCYEHILPFITVFK